MGSFRTGWSFRTFGFVIGPSVHEVLELISGEFVAGVVPWESDLDGFFVELAVDFAVEEGVGGWFLDEVDFT
jgi:hypothetical protein